MFELCILYILMPVSNNVNRTSHFSGAARFKRTCALSVLLAGVAVGGKDGRAVAAGLHPLQSAPGEACSELTAVTSRLDQQSRFLDDWPKLNRYRADNATVRARSVKPVAVFLGDSITDLWDDPTRADEFFPGKPYVNRGISGQTAPQMLLRFRQDVIELQPRVVVILAGTNDLGASTTLQRPTGYPVGHPELLLDSLTTMAELASAHGIRVVLASIPPVSSSPRMRDGRTHTELRPPARIREVNAWLRAYAARHRHTYLDYHTAMVDERGLLRQDLSNDGLHPNARGYKVMAPLAERAVQEALHRRPPPARPLKFVPDDGADEVRLADAPETPRTCSELARLRNEVASGERLLRDWAGIDRYADENRRMTTSPRVVFIGDSITDLWSEPRAGGFFPGRPYANRGISAQSTQQMVVRFRQDVIRLSPQVVVILAGTNDIGGNTGPTTLGAVEDNLALMSEIARFHRIRVVIASVLPVSDYDRLRQANPRLRTTRRPPEVIQRLNDWIRRYAAANGLGWLDYHAALTDAAGLLRDELTEDGVHPNAAGYRIMAPLAERAIVDALNGSQEQF